MNVIDAIDCVEKFMLAICVCAGFGCILLDKLLMSILAKILVFVRYKPSRMLLFELGTWPASLFAVYESTPIPFSKTSACFYPAFVLVHRSFASLQAN